MKKLFQVYKSFMIRPTVYKAFPRLIVGLLVAGLWNRYANTMQIHQMTQSIFYLIGFIFLAMAWFSYLSLDGMKIRSPSWPGVLQRLIKNAPKQPIIASR